jgi:hypothetical protein
MENKKQVIVYVDGYNFYYGLKNGGARWKKLYWLDIVKFCDHVVWLGHYRARFIQSMLPDDITLSNGYVLHRPKNWI